MTRSLTRSTLLVALVATLAACSPPQPVPMPPTLAEVAEDTAALTSFVALADALAIDLDAATDAGLVTVFAPSNALVDAYAVEWGFADAAELLAALGTLTDEQTLAVAYFVRAHVVSDFPTLMTEEFLTDGISGVEWYWYTYPEYTPGGRLFTHVYNDYDFATETDTIEVYFYGEMPGMTVRVAVVDLVFLAGDVAIENGIVHVLDGTVTFGNLF